MPSLVAKVSLERTKLGSILECKLNMDDFIGGDVKVVTSDFSPIDGKENSIPFYEKSFRLQRLNKTDKISTLASIRTLNFNSEIPCILSLWLYPRVSEKKNSRVPLGLKIGDKISNFLLEPDKWQKVSISLEKYEEDFISLFVLSNVFNEKIDISCDINNITLESKFETPPQVISKEIDSVNFIVFEGKPSEKFSWNKTVDMYKISDVQIFGSAKDSLVQNKIASILEFKQVSFPASVSDETNAKLKVIGIKVDNSKSYIIISFKINSK